MQRFHRAGSSTKVQPDQPRVRRHLPSALAHQHGLAESCRSADQAQPAVAVEQRLRQSRPPDVQRRQTGNGRELPCGTCLCTERIRNEAYGHGNGSLVLINPLKHSAVRARRYARLSRPSVETPSLSLHAAATLASRSSRRDSVLTLELLIGNYHPLVGSKKAANPAALFTSQISDDQRTPALRRAAGVKSRAEAR